MDTSNTFSDRHLEMPPISNEMKLELTAVDSNVANLSLEFRGNYRVQFKGNFSALCQLADALSNCLDPSEEMVECILVLPNGEAVLKAVSVIDLSATEKQIIVSTAITATVAIETLADAFDLSFDDAATLVRVEGQKRFEGTSPEKIEDALKQLVEQAKENPGKKVFKTEI